METSLFTNNTNYTAASLYNPKTASDINAAASDKKKTDTFEKTVEDIRWEKEHKKFQEKLRQRRQEIRREIRREQELSFQLSVERRRKMKLLMKKHEDYVRFLEGTALKKTLAERERIKDPECSAAEINSVSQSPPDAKMPMFIRVR
ncbi:MAG: hypothetical protein J1F11_00350 [Oscillospiraceae bacterium]|nr:hypothetical protein [Oscillospiraceae bacterium]